MIEGKFQILIHLIVNQPHPHGGGLPAPEAERNFNCPCDFVPAPVGLGLKESGVVRQRVERAEEAAFAPRRQIVQGGQNPVAERVARQRLVGVARIDGPAGDAVVAQEGFDFTAPEPQQRPQERHSFDPGTFAQRDEAGRIRAAQQPQQQRFGPVVGMMPEDDRGVVTVPGKPLPDVEARVPGPRFEVRARSEMQLDQSEFDAVRRGEPGGIARFAA